jgi:hypothetical protein
MSKDEEDDLYDEEFDFVDDDDDDDDDDSDLPEVDSADEGDFDESPLADDEPARERADGMADEDRTDDEEEPVDEYGRPEPAANYVVHVYEHKTFKRTIDRPFTPEDAETFATEFNRTGKSYGRVAVTSKNDAKPKKSVD